MAKTVKKPIAKCQCYKRGTTVPCGKRALPNSVFCQEHQDCPPPPLSGAEPLYLPDTWNQTTAIRKSHNCYSYALHKFDQRLINKCTQEDASNENPPSDSCRKFFHQPGCVHGERYALDAKKRRTCKEIERLTLADNPSIKKSSFYEKCPTNTSKIALVVDPGDDFHYYIEHKSNNPSDPRPFYSDKGGSNPAKRVDAIGKPIFNPELASRDYRWKGSDLNYKDFCGFYCVPRDGSVQLESNLQSGGGRWARTRRRQRARQRRARR